MEKRPPRPMTPFDELVTPPQLQMLKLFLPYTPSSNQQFLGVFIKFLELKETISFFQNIENDLHTQAFSRNHPPSPTEMLQDLKPYMPSQQAEMMDTFLNMMNIMEMVQMFQGNGDDTGGNPFAGMADMFSGGSSDGSSSSNSESGGFGGMGDMANMFSGGFNPMDMMMGMMTPEQQNMFQMYNNMFASEMNSKENAPDHTTSDQTVSNNSTSNSNTSETEASDYKSANYDNLNYDNPNNGTISDFTNEQYRMKGDDIDERMDEQSGNEEY